MLTVAIFALLAGLFWFGLNQRQRNQPLELQALLTILISVGLLCRLAFVFFTPAFYAPDEVSHYKYVQYLAEQHAFPVQTSKVGDPTNDFEYNQPPLYYLLLTPLFVAANAAFHSTAATVICLRLVSVLCWGCNVWLAKLWLRRLEVKDSFVCVFVMGMVCLLPTYVFVSAAINNDNLLATLGGALLYLLARREQTLKRSLVTGFLLGLALLAKQSAVVFVFAIAVLAAFDGIQQRLKWSAVLLQLGAVLGVATLVFLPRALWNFKVYGTFTPEFLVVTRIPWPSFLHGMVSAGHNLLKSFWAVSGITNNIGYPFPLPGMLLMALCVVAQQDGIHRARLGDDQKLGPSDAMMTALLVAVLVNIGLVLRFGYQFGMGQGRHLFSVLFPIALVLAWGLSPLPIKYPAVQAAGFWVAYAVIFTVFSLHRFP